MADVIIMISGKKLPAHSQFLASQSRLFESLMRATDNTFSKAEPLTISTPLEGYQEADVMTFLRHVYKQQPLQSEKEAWGLLPIADQFDSPSLTGKAIEIIEAAQGDSLFSHSDKDVLDWWHLAERFNLQSFKARCVTAVAQHFETLQHDARLLQLKPAAALALMKALQQVVQDRTRQYWVEDMSTHGTPGRYYIKHYFCSANKCSGHIVSVGWGRMRGPASIRELHHKTSPDCCPGAHKPTMGIEASSFTSKPVVMKDFEDYARRC